MDGLGWGGLGQGILSGLQAARRDALADAEIDYKRALQDRMFQMQALQEQRLARQYANDQNSQLVKALMDPNATPDTLQAYIESGQVPTNMLPRFLAQIGKLQRISEAEAAIDRGEDISQYADVRPLLMAKPHIVKMLEGREYGNAFQQVQEALSVPDLAPQDVERKFAEITASVNPRTRGDLRIAFGSKFPNYQQSDEFATRQAQSKLLPAINMLAAEGKYDAAIGLARSVNIGFNDIERLFTSITPDQQIGLKKAFARVGVTGAAEGGITEIAPGVTPNSINAAQAGAESRQRTLGNVLGLLEGQSDPRFMQQRRAIAEADVPGIVRQNYAANIANTQANTAFTQGPKTSLAEAQTDLARAQAILAQGKPDAQTVKDVMQLAQHYGDIAIQGKIAASMTKDPMQKEMIIRELDAISYQLRQYGLTASKGLMRSPSLMPPGMPQFSPQTPGPTGPSAPLRLHLPPDVVERLK